MPEIEFLREVLSSGGDAAMIAVCIALWRLDRRLFRLELVVEELERVVAQLRRIAVKGDQK